jgi:hypothetical protein
MTGVNPVKSSTGIIVGTAQYSPERIQRYLHWNSSLDLQGWREKIWSELDISRLFIYLPVELPDFVCLHSLAKHTFR